MPVRMKAVSKVLDAIGLKRSYNNVDWTARVNGETMSRDEFDERYRFPAERVFEAVVDDIDWNRVLLEATARHIELGHPDDDYTGMLCPECVCEALLATETFVSWKSTPFIARGAY